MKNIYSFLILLLSTTGLFAQSVTIGGLMDSTVTDNADASLVELHADVTNSAANSMDFIATKNEITTVAGTNVFFCWGACYPPMVTESNDTLTFTAGEKKKGELIMDCEPNGNHGTSIVEYCVMDAHNKSDSSCVTVRFKIDAVSYTKEIVSDKINWISMYPNPGNGVVNLVYNSVSANAVLEIRDMLGKVVMAQPLAPSYGTVKSSIDVTALNDGIYFYGISADGQLHDSSRFVIAKQ